MFPFVIENAEGRLFSVNAPSLAELKKAVGKTKAFGEVRQVRRATVSGFSPPSKNAPCPCGSGRKYKRCCGRKPT